MPTSWNVSSLIRSARLVLGIRWLIGAIDASLPGALTLDFVGRLGADRRDGGRRDDDGEHGDALHGETWCCPFLGVGGCRRV